MPYDNHNRSKASKRRHNSEEDEDFIKKKRTENTGTRKADTDTVKDSGNSGASTSSTRRTSCKDPSKTPALSRLQQLRDRIKKDLFKMGHKDSSEKALSSGGNSKNPQETKSVSPKPDSNSTKDQDQTNKNFKKTHSSPGGGKEIIKEVITIESSSESEASPKKICIEESSPKHVPDPNSQRKSRSLETLAGQMKKTTTLSPMNQRMSRIRKSSSVGGSAIKTKILNVSDKIQAGEIDSIVNTTAKSFKIPIKKKQSYSPQRSDTSKDTANSADSKVKSTSFDKIAQETPAYCKETNIFANNNNIKGSPNKMYGVMQKPISTTNENIFITNKINDIKSPEFNFQCKRSSSPKEQVRKNNTNIFATEAIGTDINDSNNSVNLSVEIIEEITSPSAFKTPNNRKTSSETVNKSSLGDRMRKIRGQLQNTEKEANKSDDDGIGVVRQNSFEELYKNPLPSCSRSTVVENWIESTHPTTNLETSASDSMLVNFDNTLLEKSELLADSQEDNSMEWDSFPDIPPRKFPGDDSSSIEENQKEKAICVVVDTNIFMHDIERLEIILNLKLPGDKKILIYVPWMVLGELDNLKEARSNIFKPFVTQKALKGQRFINKHLAETNSKIVCQSVTEVCQQLDLGKSPDDKILACCLQVQNKYETVIMLTSDINLRNKALANQVKSYPPSEIVQRLEDSKFFKIKVLTQEVLSDVIWRSSWNAYGEAVYHMKALQGGRWRFEDCLARFKQYWQPVFSHLLLKHCLKTIEELVKLAKRGNEIETNPKEFMNFVNKVKEFLFYLQDIEYFNSVVKQLRNSIDEIVKAPKEF